jgi:hypothetical protein
MGLLSIVAIPIFLGLANKAVRENAEAIRLELDRETRDRTNIFRGIGRQRRW